MRIFLLIILLFYFCSNSFGQESNINVPNTFAQELKTKIFPLETSVQLQPEIRLQHAEKKSLSKAFFYSLLLPGLGESYVGHPGYTKFFLSTEALGWGLLISNMLQVKWRTEDYKNYAIQHAGINSHGKDDQYWINIGKFYNIYEYNEQRRRDRDVNAIYTENNTNQWQWDHRDNRFYYDLKRIEAREIEQMDIYYVGGIVLNHLVSAINALRLARVHNKKLNQLSWNFDVSFDTSKRCFSLSLSKSF